MTTDARRPDQPTVTPHRPHVLDVLADAESFLLDPGQDGGANRDRWDAVREEITRTGTYWQSFPELCRGARLAWRNHSRCVGRAAWKSLIVVDRRSCSTTAGVFAAVVEHLRAATAGGRIQSMISVFRPDRDFRIHNDQIIRYAGWTQPDGTILGDPQNVAITDTALALGWAGPTQRGRFDILPLVISSAIEPPRCFDLPRDAVLEVTITHPEYPWFAELGLRWHAVPAIANMALSIGGVSYTCAPFNGFYVSAEIGGRNFADSDRYAMLQQVAHRLGLDTTRTSSLWMERAQLELIAAVQHSFTAAGVVVADHHRVEAQFVRWHDRELAAGHPTPTDRAWMLSPAGASVGSAFRHSFDNTPVNPNFYHQNVPRCIVARE
jgi:nitric-oxide synthase